MGQSAWVIHRLNGVYVVTHTLILLDRGGPTSPTTLMGGRRPGSKNKLTLARLELRQEALRRLNEDLPEDAFDGDAIALFQRIYKDPNFDPELRLEAAAKIAQFERKDAAPETEPRYDLCSLLTFWRRFHPIRRGSKIISSLYLMR